MKDSGFATDPLAALRREMTVQSGTVAEYLADPDFDDGDGFQIRDTMFRGETVSGVKFLYRQGEGLTVDPADPSLEDEFRMYLVGAVLGTVSRMNGLLPLHASAVERDGRAMAFTADSGGGKSTLAASLASRGYRHVCDDTLVLQCHDLQYWRFRMESHANSGAMQLNILAQRQSARSPLCQASSMSSRTKARPNPCR